MADVLPVDLEAGLGITEHPLWTAGLLVLDLELVLLVQVRSV